MPDYDDMPAGREMNAAVAEKVMGWVKRRMFLAEINYGRDLPDRGDWVWASPDQKSGDYHWHVERFDPSIPEEDFVAGFYPSEDIAAAWEVVEKMRESGYWFDWDDQYDEPCAGFVHRDTPETGYFVSKDHRFEHDFCVLVSRAALKAVNARQTT